jgi:hypothetical protein
VFHCGADPNVRGTLVPPADLVDSGLEALRRACVARDLAETLCPVMTTASEYLHLGIGEMILPPELRDSDQRCIVIEVGDW